MMTEIITQHALQQVCELIQDVNGIELSCIKGNDRLISDLKMDSIELIDLLVKLEEIGVTINESQISSHLMVKDIAKLVELQGVNLIRKNGALGTEQ